MRTKIILSVFTLFIIESAINAEPNVQTLSYEHEKFSSNIEPVNEEIIPKNIELKHSFDGQKKFSIERQPESEEEEIELPVIDIEEDEDSGEDSIESESVIESGSENHIKKQKELDRKQKRINENRRAILSLKIKIQSKQNDLNNKQKELDNKKLNLLQRFIKLNETEKELEYDKELLAVKKDECKSAKSKFNLMVAPLYQIRRELTKTRADLDLEQMAKDRKQNTMNLNIKQLEVHEKKIYEQQLLLNEQKATIVSQLNKIDSNKRELLSGTKTIGSKQPESDSQLKQLSTEASDH